MGHTTSDRRERAREKELLRAEIAEAERAAKEEIEHAKAVVAAWNERKVKNPASITVKREAEEDWVTRR